MNPDFAAAHSWKSAVHLWRSEYDAAIEEGRKALDLDRAVFLQLALAQTLAHAGEKDEAQGILDEVLTKEGGGHISPVGVGEVMLALGRWDEGFEWLEKGLAKRDVGLLYFGSSTNPFYQKYRSDPRWKRIDASLPYMRA